MAEFPEKAKVVIIGVGGIVGASVAHHLIERGWDDIVGIDKSAIPTDIGSTAHASDFCYATSHDFLSAGRRFTRSISSRRRGRYAKVGGFEIAVSATTAGWTRSSARFRLRARLSERGARLVGAAEDQGKFPLVEEEPGAGRLWDPDAGLVARARRRLPASSSMPARRPAS
jgi:glycine/D-amino acid oxidase-like deaminating enzyme